MAYNFNRSNGMYLSTTSTPVTTPPLTMVAWYKPTDTSSAQVIISICTSTGTHRFQIVMTTTPTYRCNAVSATTSGFAEATLGPSIGVWGHVAAVFSSNSSRTCYFNGGNSGTSSVTSTPTETLSQIQIGSVYINGASNFAHGDIAEVGIWNVALTASEILSLSRGITSSLIRPQSLIFYAPLIRNLIDLNRGLSITNNNSATIVNHPRIYI